MCESKEGIDANTVLSSPVNNNASFHNYTMGRRKQKKRDLSSVVTSEDFQSFPLLDLPKNVLEDVGRLMDNYERRQLALSCRKFYHLFDGHAPSLDARRMIEITIYVDSIEHAKHFVDTDMFEVQIAFAERRHEDDERRHVLPEYIRRTFRGTNAVEECRDFIKQCSIRYYIRRVRYGTLLAKDETYTFEELFSLCPEDVCDNIIFECPDYRNYWEPPTGAYELKALHFFLEKSFFRALLFNVGISHVGKAEMNEYIDILKDWCVSNEYGMVVTQCWHFKGFCKVTLDEKPHIVVAIENSYEYKHEDRGRGRRGRRGRGYLDHVEEFRGPRFLDPVEEIPEMEKWFNSSIMEDRWYSGTFRVVRKLL